jgi:hypothetical protein
LINEKKAKKPMRTKKKKSENLLRLLHQQDQRIELLQFVSGTSPKGVCVIDIVPSEVPLGSGGILKVGAQQEVFCSPPSKGRWNLGPSLCVLAVR